MTLIELVAKLRSTGYPVAYSHFKTDGGNQPPSLPFITYLTPGREDLQADNVNYHKLQDVEIELYTKGKDLIAEGNIEQILHDNELPFTNYQIWIDSEQVFQTIYEVRMI